MRRFWFSSAAWRCKALKSPDLSNILVQRTFTALLITATVAFGIGGAIALGLGGREAVQKFLAKKVKD